MVSINRLFRHTLAFAGLITILVVTPGFGQNPPYPQQQPQLPQPSPYPQQQPAAKPQQNQNGSQEELDAAKKVEQAQDAETRLKAATDFAKKYPKSSYMNKVAILVAAKIDEVKDGAQKVTFAQTYKAIFKGPEESAIIEPVLLDGYIKANRLDEAFQQGAADLQRDPNDVEITTRLALVAYDEVRRRNAKYAAQGLDYGAKAIALIEADKKPERLTAEQWTQYKTRLLAALYQGAGYFLLATKKPDEAQARLEKSVAINPNDPFTYVLLGAVANDRYEDLATKYKAMSPGPAQDDALKAALVAMDKVIDYYAHAVALSEGSAPLQALHDGVLQELTNLYKYRHSNSQDGLQQLIDKYKKAPSSAAPGH